MAELTPQEARISKLLRVRVVAQAGDDVLAYLAERLEQIYPEEYKAYRRRWQELGIESNHTLLASASHLEQLLLFIPNLFSSRLTAGLGRGDWCYLLSAWLVVSQEESR